MAALGAADFAPFGWKRRFDFIAGFAHRADNQSSHLRSRNRPLREDFTDAPCHCPIPLIPDREFSIKSRWWAMLRDLRNTGDPL
jgi:hypothetical protein